MTMRRHVHGRQSQESGFSVVELVVSSLILMLAVVAMASLFDSSNRVAKTENSVSDQQQSSRFAAYQLVRESRMAGAGGLPATWPIPGTGTSGVPYQLGLSLGLGSSTFGAATKFITNDINAATDSVCIGAACGSAGAHHVRKGTDILHVRGVMQDDTLDLSNGTWTAGTGTLVINPCSQHANAALQAGDPNPCSGNLINDTSPFVTCTYTAGGPNTSPCGMLFVMYDDQTPNPNLGLGLILSVATTPVAGGNQVTLTLDIATNAYMLSLNLNGAFPANMSGNPQRGGIVDDRVFFIDDGPKAPADKCIMSGATSNATLSPGPCHPVLSVADWAPGDSAAAPFSKATVTPIADDIEDMQIAYGVDFFDLTTFSACGVPSNCTLSHPAPDPTKDPLHPEDVNLPRADGSISIASITTFNSIVTNARGATPPSPPLDPSESSTKDGDEWIWNVAGEPGNGGTFDYTSDLSRLRALEISLLSKGAEPDTKGLKFVGAVRTPNWIGALAWPLMDSAAVTVSDPTAGNGMAYHRRVDTIRVMVRNFQANQ